MDYIDKFRVLGAQRTETLNAICKAAKPMEGLVSKEAELEVLLQNGETVIKKIDMSYKTPQHGVRATFYEEAKKTVGRGILKGLITPAVLPSLANFY